MRGRVEVQFQVRVRVKVRVEVRVQVWVWARVRPSLGSWDSPVPHARPLAPTAPMPLAPIGLNPYRHRCSVVVQLSSLLGGQVPHSLSASLASLFCRLSSLVLVKQFLTLTLSLSDAGSSL